MSHPTDPNSLPDSLWQLKPWWCQPWSIVLTGVGLVAIAWLLFQRWWIAAPVAIAVLAWWFLFLLWVPRQYTAAVRQQRSI
jgi:hypothetical protein